ncbi:MAG: M50 family metallopeptidase [Candidatus Andersenbacteria bacterium]
MDVLITILTFGVLLGVLIFVHELGHFIAARRAGMLVEEFGFGFPPRLWGIKRGETTYSINWIPFGGFVKIRGEDGGEEHDPRSFAAASFGRRALVLAAGVSMNFVLAFTLLWIVNAVGTTTAVGADQGPLPTGAIAGPAHVTITSVTSSSPAGAAGLRPGDEVLLVDGVTPTDERSVSSAVAAKAGSKLTLHVRRGGQEFDIRSTPRTSPPAGEGPLGVGLAVTALVRYPWYQAAWEAAKQTVFVAGQIFVVFGRLLHDLFTTGRVSSDVAGPVGIAVLTGHVRALGFVPLLQFAALLSVNLGVVNALPIPALDGGRLLFLLIERIRRRKVSKKVEQVIHSVGFAALLLLIAAISVRDVLHYDVIGKIKDLFHG